MPAIPIPRSAPIGNLRNLTESNELAPRADYTLGLKSQKVDQLGAQTVQAQISSAGETIDTGTQLVAQGAVQLDAYDKLRQSREVMAATGISTSAILDVRHRLEEIRTSGKPYLEWQADAEKAFTEVEGQARIAAEKISPAAGLEVSARLAQERLSGLATVQKEVLTQDINTQLGHYHEFKELRRQDYEAAPPGSIERRNIENDIFGRLDVLSRTGVLTPDLATREKIDWIKSVGVSNGIATALRPIDAGGGLDAAFQEIQGNRSLSVVEKKNAFSQAHEAASHQLAQAHKADTLALQKIKSDQAALGLTYYKDAGDLKKTPAELEALIDKVLGLGITPVGGRVPAQYLTDEDARGIISLARKTIAEKLNPPERDDRKKVAELSAAIYNDPSSLTNPQITTMQDISGASMQTLLSLRADRVNHESFMNRKLFKEYMDEIGAAVAKDSGGFSMNDQGELLKLHQIRQQGKTRFLTYMQSVAHQANPDGILKEKDIETLGKAIKDDIIKKISQMKMSELITQQNLTP